MGIYGLMSFIHKNYNFCLKERELSDCYLVIDGSNIAILLAKGLESHSAFGGDYDEYSSVVRNFMLGLKQCNISPIILLGGCYVKTKFGRRLRSRQETLLRLKPFNQGFSENHFSPLLLVEVFLSVVRDMGFMCVQCDFEADWEVAGVAKKLNCPILSNDSDFFISDAMFIPYATFQQTPVKHSQTFKYYIKCCVYTVDEFLKATGLDRPLLYLSAMLLDQDCKENDTFSRFFDCSGIPKYKSLKRFKRLMKWLKNKNINSALNYICSCFTEEDAEKVYELFNATKTKYTNSFISKSVSGELLNKFGITACDLQSTQSFKIILNINWPSQIATLFPQTILPSFLISIVLYQNYLTPLQVEDFQDLCSHLRCIRLIKIMYAMLTPYLKTKEPLQMYLMQGCQYTCVNIDASLSNCINLHKVLEQPREERLNLLCDLIGVPVNDLKSISCNSWAIFMLSFIYWVEEFRNSLSLAHIHAFIIMTIANQIVQTRVGYYKNSEEFMRHYGDEIEKLKDMNITLERSDNFKEMLSNVKHLECLIVQKALMPLRKTTEFAVSNYDIKTIHLYNCFQTCVFYIGIINSLLDHPLPPLKLQHFYSGTLLFNLYLSIISKSSIEEFGSALFLQTPNLNQIYKYLSGKLSGILEKNAGKKSVREK